VGNFLRYFWGIFIDNHTEKRLSRAERRLSKKQKGSKNRGKAKLSLAKMSRHVACRRKDFLDKESRRLADRYDVICIEDLDMRAMSRSLRLGKSTLDNGWGMFTRMLRYKLSDRGGMLIRVGRLFPSSQLCQCGYQNPITKDLNIRTVTCPKCGRTYDRDINAALNIKKEGCRIFLSEHPAAV
jgi:putative transposase